MVSSVLWIYPGETAKWNKTSFAHIYIFIFFEALIYSDRIFLKISVHQKYN